MRGSALRPRLTLATSGCPSRGEPGLGGRLQGRRGPEAREPCVWSPRGTWNTPAGAGREKQKETPGCAGPKASDRTRPMRKPKLGGPETCEKPEGMHASWRRQRILPRRKQRIWVLSQGRKQLGLPPIIASGIKDSGSGTQRAACACTASSPPPS